MSLLFHAISQYHAHHAMLTHHSTHTHTHTHTPPLHSCSFPRTLCSFLLLLAGRLCKGCCMVDESNPCLWTFNRLLGFSNAGPPSTAPKKPNTHTHTHSLSLSLHLSLSLTLSLSTSLSTSLSNITRCIRTGVEHWENAPRERPVERRPVLLQDEELKHKHHRGLDAHLGRTHGEHALVHLFAPHACSQARRCQEDRQRGIASECERVRTNTTHHNTTTTQPQVQAQSIQTPVPMYEPHLSINRKEPRIVVEWQCCSTPLLTCACQTAAAAACKASRPSASDTPHHTTPPRTVAQGTPPRTVAQGTAPWSFDHRMR